MHIELYFIWSALVCLGLHVTAVYCTTLKTEHVGHVFAKRTPSCFFKPQFYLVLGAIQLSYSVARYSNAALGQV